MGADDVKRVGRPRAVEITSKPTPWEKPAIAKAVAEILAAVDARPVDSTVRLALQRIYHRKELFGGDGRGQVTLVIRTILESEGNADALVEPIVGAVEMAMRPQWTERGLAWIEAFDQIKLTEILQTMRGLDLFSEQSLPAYFSDVLHNKLLKILGPAKAAAKPAAKPEPKPPRSLTRVPGVEKNIHLGLELLSLRSTIKGNAAFGHAVRHRFDVDGQHACEVMKVARAYGTRPEIFTRLSWNALLYLASPALPAAAREALERRIVAGERVGAPEIRAARGAPAGRGARRGAPRKCWQPDGGGFRSRRDCRT